MKEIRATSCSNDCFGHCAIRATLEDGRLIRTEGDPSSPATQGFLCPKGNAWPQILQSPERLLAPLRRLGSRGSGHWETVSWQDALDDIALRLQRIRVESGPSAVLYMRGSGCGGILNGYAERFWRLYGGYTGVRGDVCWAAGKEAGRLTYGAARQLAPWHIPAAGVIVLWGKNSAATNIHEWKLVREAQKSGTIVVVIDPRQSETAETADLYLSARPGTDGALALAVAQVLISQKQIAKEYVASYVHGYEEFAQYVKDCTPEWAERETGITEDQIRQLAQLLATHSPALIITGMGVQRYSNGGQNARAIAVLPALLGSVGKRGGGWAYANTQSRLPAGAELSQPDLPGVLRTIAHPTWASDLQTMQNPPILAAWIEAANPVTQHPNSNEVRKALSTLDLLVVADPFLTDTAELADYVLPSKMGLEQTDITTGMWHPHLLIREQVAEPPGQVKPETWIYRQLAERMAMDLAWFPEDTDRVIDETLQKAGLSLEQLRKGPILQEHAQEIPYSNGEFETPSGKIELWSEQAKELWGVDPLPRYCSPVNAASTQYPFRLLTPHPKGRIHSQHHTVEVLRHRMGQLECRLHPETADARGIVDGGSVLVSNEQGRLVVVARVTDRAQPGMVEIDQGWRHSDGGSANLLTPERVTDLGELVAYAECWVNIAPIGLCETES